jgi:hypothetical protein
MSKIVLTMMAFFLLMCQSAFAANPYPSTLDNGNLDFVDGQMGYGIYAIRSSVNVQNYNPPQYQIAINTISVNVDNGTRGKYGRTILNITGIVRPFTIIQSKKMHG